jgi:hypothetical protein
METKAILIGAAIAAAAIGYVLTSIGAARAARFLAVFAALMLGAAIASNQPATLAIVWRTIAAAPNAVLRAVAIAPGMFFVAAWLAAILGLAIRAHYNR